MIKTDKAAFLLPCLFCRTGWILTNR